MLQAVPTAGAKRKVVVEPQQDGSLWWQLPDQAGEQPRLKLPKVAMARLRVAANTHCTLLLPDGDAFDSKLIYNAQSEGGHISTLWPAMRTMLQLRGAETISLRPDRDAGGRLMLHLRVEARPEEQVCPVASLTPSPPPVPSAQTIP